MLASTSKQLLVKDNVEKILAAGYGHISAHIAMLRTCWRMMQAMAAHDILSFNVVFKLVSSYIGLALSCYVGVKLLNPPRPSGPKRVDTIYLTPKP